MKIIMKITSVIFLFAIAISMFQLGKTLFVESYNWIKPDIDTEFTQKYDEKYFQKIKLGDNINDIVKQIGEPFYIKESELGEYTWSYSNDGKCKWFDFAWLQRAVIVDKNGTVINIKKNIIHD